MVLNHHKTSEQKSYFAVFFITNTDTWQQQSNSNTHKFHSDSKERKIEVLRCGEKKYSSQLWNLSKSNETSSKCTK